MVDWHVTSASPQVHGLALVQGVQEGGEMSADVRARRGGSVEIHLKPLFGSRGRSPAPDRLPPDQTRT